MANETYRYNVVVKLDIETNGANQGKQQAQDGLRQWEQQAIQSAQRVANEMRTASTETAKAYKNSMDLMNNYNNQRIERERQINLIASSNFKAEEEKKKQAFRDTVRYIESQDPYSKFFFKSKQEGLAFGKTLDEIFGKSKKLSADDILGRADDNIRKANVQAKVFREELRQILALNSQLANQNMRGSFNASGTNQLGFGNPSQQASSLFTPSNSYIRSFATTPQRQLSTFTPLSGVLNDPFANGQQFKIYEKGFKDIESSSKNAGAGIGYFGSAFTGAFTGAIAGTAFRILSEIPSKFFEISVASVKSSADLERQTLAFTAITGSASRAKDELKAIADLARNTPSLGLQTAEKGALALRAVGFADQQTRDILEGTSKIKALSGASQESLDRFIYNLTQVRSAGKLTGMELRDALRELPAIAPVLQKAFGTTNAEKIRELGLSSDEFFERLIKQLKATNGISGGTFDNIEKLQDAFIEAQRTFGEPLLDPVNEGIKDLTKFLDENKQEWKAWGETTRDVLNGFLATAKGLSYLGYLKYLNPDLNDVVGGLARPKTDAQGNSTGYFSAKTNYALSEASRVVPRLSALTSPSGIYTEVFREIGAIKDLPTRLTTGITPVAEGTFAPKANEIIQIQKYADVVKSLDTNKANKLLQLENAFNTQNSQNNVGLATSRQAQLTRQQQRIGLLESAGAGRISILTQDYEATSKANNDYLSTFQNDADRARARKNKGFDEIEAKKANEIEQERLKISSQLIDEDNKVLELQKAIREERRQTRLETIALNIAEKNLTTERLKFDVMRKPVSISNLASNLTNISNTELRNIRNSNREKLNVDLQNEDLTPEQRLNLIKKYNLEEKTLAEKHRQDLIQIADSQLSALRAFGNEMISLQADRVNQRVDNFTFNIQRQIEMLPETASKSYDELISVTQNKYDFLRQVEETRLKIQLQDEKLTYEERELLFTKYTLTEADLAEKSRREVIAIEKQKSQAVLDEIAMRGSEAQKFYEQQSKNASNFSIFGDLNILSSPNLNSLLEKAKSLAVAFDEENKSQVSFYKNASIRYANQAKEISQNIARQKSMLANQIDSVATPTGENGSIFMQDESGNIPVVVDNKRKVETERRIADLQGDELQYRGIANKFAETATRLQRYVDGTEATYGKLQKEVFQLYIDVTKGVGDNTIFDKIIEKNFLASRELEKSGLELKVKNLNEQFIQAQSDLSKGVISPLAVTKIASDLTEANNALKSFNFQTEVGKENLDLLSTAQDRYNKLLNGDTGQVRLSKFKAELDYTKEKTAQLNELIALEYRLANSPLIDQTAVQIAQTKDLIALRGQDTEILIRQNKAKLEIGQQLIYNKNEADTRVLEALASQKGITDIISESKISAMTTAYSALDKVAEKLSKSFGFASDAVKDLISNLLRLAVNSIFKKIFGLTNSTGSSGGGFGTGGESFGLPNLLGGILGGNRGGATATNTSGGLSNLITGGGSPSFGNIFGGGATQSATQSATNNPNLGGIFGGLLGGGNSDLLGAGTANTGTTVTATTGSAGILGSLSAMLPAGLATVGIGLFLNSLKAKTPIKGALQGGLVGLIAGFINQSKLRRKEETIHNDAMLKALNGLDNIVFGLNNNTLDANSALSQADALKAEYLSTANALTDKKTRNIATSASEVARIDAKIKAVKDAISNQKARQERQDLLVPTFADGGSISGFINKQYKNNPLGYQSGSGHSRSDNLLGYFPSAKQFAYTSPSEYVLDAKTVSNIGIHELELMRATQGQSFNNLKDRKINKFADGGSISQSPVNIQADSNPSNSSMSMNLSLNIGLAVSDFVELIEGVLRSSDASEQQISNIITSINKEGVDHPLLQTLNQKLKNK